MLDVINDVVALVPVLDPAYDLSTLAVKVVHDVDKSHPTQRRWHIISAHQAEQITNLDVQVVPLSTLADLNPCTQLHVEHPSKTHVIDGITDTELGQALSDLLSVKALLPGENDGDEIIQSIDSTHELGDLVGQFLRYEEDLFDEFSQLSHQFHPADSRYAQTLRDEINRVLADLEHLRRTTIASPRAITILQQEAMKRYGIDIDESLVHVVVDQVVLNAKRAEHSKDPSAGPKAQSVSNGNDVVLPKTDDDYTIPITIIAALCGTDQLYSTSLMVLPRWAAELTNRVAPGVLASGFYPIGTTSPVVLETAKGIWSTVDGEALADFDAAFKAATELVR